MQKLSCPRGGVSKLTFSPDGDMLAGIGTNTLFCWTRSRNWEKTGLENPGPITGLTFHPAGRTLAYAGIAASWTTPLPPPPPPGQPVPSVWRRRFARQTPRPFTGVHLYPLTGTDEFVPNRLGVPHAPETVVRSELWARGLAFTPDGRTLLSGHVEPTGFTRTRVNIYHWHFNETGGVWQAVDSLAAALTTERGGALVGDSCLALAGAWGVATCPVVSGAGLFVPDVRAATATAVAARDELIVTCERLSEVKVWHLRHPAPVAVIAVPGWAVTLALAPDGRELAVGHSDGAVGVVGFWDVPSGAPGPQRDFGVGPIQSLAYAPDSLTLAVAGRNGLVVVDVG